MSNNTPFTSEAYPGCPALDEGWKNFRKELTPLYGIVWRDIITCHLMILLGLSILVTSNFIYGLKGSIPCVILAAIWIGYWLQSLLNFGHEALHHNIAENNDTNDSLSNWFIFSFIGLDTQWSRKYHWTHHVKLGTPEDTEISYHNRLTPLFLFQMLTGLYFLKSVIPYVFSTKTKQKEKYFGRLTALCRAILLHGSIMFLCLHFKLYASTVGWMLALFIFYPTWLALRQMAEHSSENAQPGINYHKEPYGTTLRLFSPGLFSNTFGSAGFTRHILHHWDPHISYTRLKEMEDYFLTSELANHLNSFRSSYFKAYIKLFKWF